MRLFAKHAKSIWWFIAAILAVVMLSRIRIVQQGWTPATIKKKILDDLMSINTLAERYRAVYGVYPSSMDELRRDDKSFDSSDKHALIYLKDPWNNDYLIKTDKDGILRITCLGRDGLPGGVGDNQDVTIP